MESRLPGTGYKSTVINETGLAVLGALLIAGGVIFIAQRVVSADVFNMRIVLIDKGAIGGVIAIILGIVCCVVGEKYGNKYKELKKKLQGYLTDS